MRLSLLRAPLFPDPDADQGEHRFRVALRVGATIGDAVAEGYRLNLPLRRVRGGDDVAPLVVVDDPAVVVEAVKLAEDGSGDVVVRLYEALGSRAAARITADVRPRVGGRDRPAGAPAARAGRARRRPARACARSRSSPCASSGR